MLKTISAVVALGTLSSVTLFSCADIDCHGGIACNGPTADGGGIDGASDAVPDVPVPPGCDAAAEPKDAPKCVVSEFGVFVDATAGADGNPGTKESPVKTLGAALGKLAGKSRVYVCEGTYPEHLSLTSPVSLYAGFACSSWTYTGAKAKVAPTDAGYALEVAGASGPLLIVDLAFAAAPGTSASPSSIAAWVADSSAVTFRRTDLTAAAGFDGTNGAGGAPGTADKALDGIGAMTTTPGVLKTCTCTSGGTSTGGGGGAPGTDGQNGGPNIPENPLGQVPPKDGKAGTGNVPCSPTGSGHNGANAADAADAAAITSVGKLTATGWTPTPGIDGAAAAPGQGGGGGGGRAGAGGGGACGGCGGTGGKAGTAGGASVALVSFNANVSLVASTLTSAKAGAGGAGGGAGMGAAGGGGAIGGAPNGCGGGDGGKGGNGGAGAGGAGGLSVTVLYTGPKPTADASTLTPGDFGPKGAGGAATNDGLDGLRADFLEAPK